MPTKERHRQTKEQRKRVHKPMRRHAKAEHSSSASGSYSGDSESVSSAHSPSRSPSRSPTPAQQEFAQIYTKNDYQKLLRDYRALYDAHEAGREASEALRTQLAELQTVYQRYILQHEEEAKASAERQAQLEAHVREMLSGQFAQLQSDLREGQERNAVLSQSNQQLGEDVRKMRESQRLRLSDLAGQFNQRETALQQAKTELTRLKRILVAYEVLTGVQIATGSKFEPSAVTGSNQLKFCLGDPDDPQSFHARLAFTPQKAAIECIKAPAGSSRELFQAGVACETSELWIVFGQMCARVAQDKIGAE